MLEKIEIAEINEVKELDDTARGAGESHAASRHGRANDTMISSHLSAVFHRIE